MKPPAVQKHVGDHLPYLKLMNKPLMAEAKNIFHYPWEKKPGKLLYEENNAVYDE